MCAASALKPARKARRVQATPPQNPTFGDFVAAVVAEKDAATADIPVQILRIRGVEAVTGLRKSMIYLLKSRGEFPESVKLSRYSTGWFKHEVEQWIRSRPRS
jgi:prophage regulatory protein